MVDLCAAPGSWSQVISWAFSCCNLFIKLVVNAFWGFFFSYKTTKSNKNSSSDRHCKHFLKNMPAYGVQYSPPFIDPAFWYTFQK